MSTNQILFGLGLVLVLAVGSQLLARSVKIPALVVLLPAGFLAGIATGDVHPDNLLGSLYQPFVSIAVIRPAAVALTTLRSSFTWHERAFVAWMAPRGIVAGATASAFGPELAQKGIAGADKVLPIVFVAIFGTVVVYGLTASLAARMLGVAGAGRRLVLIVSGHPWAREIAEALKRSGVAVRMWVGPVDHRTAARDAGLDAGRGRIMVDAVSREAELEEVTDALLLTRSDDFNALGAAELRDELGHQHVYRVAPHPDEPDLLPPSREVGILGNSSLTFAELDRQFTAGARIESKSADQLHRSEGTRTEMLLFAVARDGRLSVAADDRPPMVRSGDTVIVLVGVGSPDATAVEEGAGAHSKDRAVRSS